METYEETAKKNYVKLLSLLSDWSKYYKIKMKVMERYKSLNPMVIQLTKGNKSFTYWLATGRYYDNRKFKGGEIKVEMLYTLLYGTTHKGNI